MNYCSSASAETSGGLHGVCSVHNNSRACVGGWVRVGRRQRRRRWVKILMEILMRCREGASERELHLPEWQKGNKLDAARSHLPWNASPGQINGKRENLIKVGASTRLHSCGRTPNWMGAREHLKMNEHAKCKPVFMIRGRERGWFSFQTVPNVRCRRPLPHWCENWSTMGARICTAVSNDLKCACTFLAKL